SRRPWLQGSSFLLRSRKSLFNNYLVAVARDQGGQHARGGILCQEVDGAVAAQGVDAAGMEGIKLPGVVAIDHAAASPRRQAVAAETEHTDGGVVVGPGRVEHPAIRSIHPWLRLRVWLPARIILMPASVLRHHDRVRQAVGDVG